MVITDTRTNTDYLITSKSEAYSVLYSMVASLFSYPTEMRFDILRNNYFREKVVNSIAILNNESDEMLLQVKYIFTQVDQNDTPSFVSRNSIIFGHTLSKDVTPYEIENLENEEIFYRTQCLSDIGAFYSAFGLEVDSLERADHLSVECEFISLLWLKEYIAKEMDKFSDKAIICKEAREKFMKEHFSIWANKFADKLINSTDDLFYKMSAGFLQNLLKIK